MAREAHLESKERALIEKQLELARRQGILKSIEKALHVKERMIQARGATLEAKIRRYVFFSIFRHLVPLSGFELSHSCFLFQVQWAQLLVV